MRGEYKSRKSIDKKKIGSPPLARGIRCFGSVPKRPHRITPACAGNTHWTMFALGGLWDHPRLRGEYFQDTENPVLIEGSPPLARGIQKLDSIYDSERGITPACAGNTITYSFRCGYHRDHPRLRGEYKLLVLPKLDVVGSPPLARGIRLI